MTTKNVLIKMIVMHSVEHEISTVRFYRSKGNDRRKVFRTTYFIKSGERGQRVQRLANSKLLYLSKVFISPSGTFVHYDFFDQEE